jgi:hypothetical protein
MGPADLASLWTSSCPTKALEAALRQELQRLADARQERSGELVLDGTHQVALLISAGPIVLLYFHVVTYKGGLLISFSSSS